MRRTFDFRRLSAGLARPGADTRSWICTARVDDDSDAIRWEPPCGWIVDVHITSGELAGHEAPLPCRVGQESGGDGSGDIVPPNLGCEVLILVTDGDPNANPVIIAYLFNGDGCEPPSIVNLFPVVEAVAQGTRYQVSKGNFEGEYQGSWRLGAAGGIVLIAPLVTLAGGVALGGTPPLPAPVLGPLGTSLPIPAADGFPILEIDDSVQLLPPAESYVRGDKFKGDLENFLDGLSTYVGAVGTTFAGIGVAGGALSAAALAVPLLVTLSPGFLALQTAAVLMVGPTTAMQAAIAAFKTGITEGMLSSKIRGD